MSQYFVKCHCFAYSSIGLLGLNFSDSPPFRDLGNIAAIGVIATFIYTTTILPALFSLLPASKVCKQQDCYSFFIPISDFVINNKKILFWGILGIVLVVASFIPQTKLEDNFVDYFDEQNAFRLDTDFTDNNLTGVYDIQYSLKAKGPGGVVAPEYLQDMQAFADWYQKQPGVIHVHSITSILKRLNKNMHGDDPTYYKLPDNKDIAAQYLLLYELSLPYGLDLNDRISLDKSETRLTVLMNKLSTSEVRELEKRAQQWLATNAPYMASEGTGSIIMFAYISERNIKSMLGGALLAVILIAITLSMALGSLSFGLLSLLPNALPILTAFGIWAIFVGEIGLSGAAIAIVSIGIVVDDTVHFLSKYLRAKRQNHLNTEEAIRYSFKMVGAALSITSIILIVGFLVLTLSSFKLNVEMGLLTSITIAFALLADVFFLPTLLLYFDNDKESSHQSADHSA